MAKPVDSPQETRPEAGQQREANGKFVPGGKSINPSGRAKRKNTTKPTPKLLGSLRPNTKAYHRSVRWRGKLLAQMGGKITTHQRALVDEAAISKTALDTLNVWLLKNQDRPKMSTMLRVLAARMALMTAMARLF